MKFRRYNLSATHNTNVDFTILVTVALLLIFGLIMVHDSSAIQALRDFGNSYYYIRQQLIWVILGVISATFFSFFDYHRLKEFSFPMLVGAIILLLAVFIPGLGVSGGGAHRWLRLGFFTVQPAEIIKLVGVIYLASVFEKRIRLSPLLMLIGVVVFIVAMLQRDLGSALVFIFTALIIYFASGGPMWHFMSLIPIGVIGFLGLVLTSPYRVKRILAFIDPFSDMQGFTYHISQVLIALGSGGFLGLGLGHSRQKYEYIPEVSTDSIFAIIGEELGFVGSVFVITLLTVLILRGLKIASNCPDEFGKILAVGIISWFGVQAVINLSAMVALMPLTGVPLPFISYGGSALVANLTAVGILLNISKQSAQ